jgi:hypothetical protein
MYMFVLHVLVKGRSFQVRVVHGRAASTADLDAEWNPVTTMKEDIFALLAMSVASTSQQRIVLARCPKCSRVADMIPSGCQSLNLTINTEHDIKFWK